MTNNDGTNALIDALGALNGADCRTTQDTFDELVEQKRNERLSEIETEVEKQDSEKQKKEEYVNNYVNFLNKNKTVREVNRATAEMATAAGFVEAERVESGDVDIKDVRGLIFHSKDWQNVALAVIGERDMAEYGVRMSAAHADAPCFHPKPNPIIVPKDENGKNEFGGVMLDLQPYGGFIMPEKFGRYVIKGEVIENGKARKLNEVVGNITPLLPHISRTEDKKVGEAYLPDSMNLSTGHSSERELLNALGLESSADFARASIEVVPAGQAERMGDLIVGYGQDDRSGIYGQTAAIIDYSKNDRKNTGITLNADKEEIGSVGISGAEGDFKKNVIRRVARLKTGGDYGKLSEEAFIAEKVLPNGFCASFDVDTAYHPTYGDKFDPRNASHAGRGVGIKRVPCRIVGKGGGSEASAETMDWITGVLKGAGVPYQTRMMSGNLNTGAGGGTISMYFAKMGMPTVDLGVPIRGMHSNDEEIHKDDAYSAKRAIEAIFTK